MNVAIRAFVKTPIRLRLTQDTITSVFEQGLWQPGKALGVLNAAPEYDPALQGWLTGFARQVGPERVGRHEYRYRPDHDLKEGFIHSVRLAEGLSGDRSLVLALTDDVRLGRGTTEALEQIEGECIPLLERAGVKWGCISLFACYDRTEPVRVLGQAQPLFELGPAGFYGGIAMILAPSLVDILWADLAEIVAGRKEMRCLEDIWINRTMREHNYRWFNTLQDYAWHTGNDARVANAGGAKYQTRHYVGD